MYDFISSFSSSKSFQLVNDQLSWEEENFQRHDYHDPPYALRVGLYDDKYPPQRLTGVARLDHWRTIPAQVEFIGCALRRRRSSWVAKSDCWNTGRREDYIRKDRRGDDCHPDQEIHAFAPLAAAKITLGCGIRPPSEQHWRGWVLSEELASECLQVKRGLVVQTIRYIVIAYDAATKCSFMRTPARTLDQLNKVVVGLLKGDRVKGYVCEFSSLEDSFNLFPQENPLQGQAIKVEMKDLKAVYFVWDFSGKSQYLDFPRTGAPMDGRKIKVTFTDGEKIVGRTEGYTPQRIGFFMHPDNPRGNIIRIFVVTRNTRQVKLV